MSIGAGNSIIVTHKAMHCSNSTSNHIHYYGQWPIHLKSCLRSLDHLLKIRETTFKLDNLIFSMWSIHHQSMQKMQKRGRSLILFNQISNINYSQIVIYK